MLKSFLTGAGLILAVATSSQAQTAHENTLNLRGACSHLVHKDEIRDCQKAFAIAADNMVATQKRMLMASHYVSVGKSDEPETVLISTPPRLASQLTNYMNRLCRNIANRDQLAADSERLDDGSRANLYRITERALSCTKAVETAARVAQVPVPTSLILNLQYNAEDVRQQTNRIAYAP